MISQELVKPFLNKWCTVRTRNENNKIWYNFGLIIALDTDGLVLENESGAKIMIAYSEIIKISEKIRGKVRNYESG